MDDCIQRWSMLIWWWIELKSDKPSVTLNCYTSNINIHVYWSSLSATLICMSSNNFAQMEESVKMLHGICWLNKVWGASDKICIYWIATWNLFREMSNVLSAVHLTCSWACCSIFRAMQGISPRLLKGHWACNRIHTIYLDLV